MTLIAVVLPAMAACATTGSPNPTTGGTTTPAPPATSVSGQPTSTPGQLSCADAYTNEPQESEPTAFTASGVGFESLSKTGFDPIPAQNALPWDASGYFSKSPIYLDDSVTWAELTAIKGDVTFAWVPAPVWTGIARAHGATYEAPTARFESCNGSYTGFLGGILTPTAQACITLGIRSNIHPEVEPFPVAIGKGSCG